MTTFYFVRHGKTELNLQTSFQGSGIDSPLLPEGIDQAVELGQYLSDEAFDLVAVSTQKRAMDTANYIVMENNHLNQLTVVYHDGLREIGFGDREGMQVDETDVQTDYLRHRPDMYDPSEFGGESFDELVQRSSETIKTLHQQFPNGKVLIVAHGVLLLVLTNYLIGKNKKDWRTGGPLENTSLTIVDYTPEQSNLKVFNDISYRSSVDEQ